MGTFVAPSSSAQGKSPWRPMTYVPPGEDADAPIAFVDFAFERDVPPDWIRTLRALSPKSDEVSWLYLHWEPGDPWVPGQRFVLYQMLHESFVDFELVRELDGPHPRSEGHMCSVKVPGQFQCLCRRKTEGWRGGPSAVTLTQWQLYRATGYVPLPFWIIQGTTGGHKWAFDEQERDMLKMADLPSEPPPLGFLPYAPFDERVVKQIVQHNRLLQMDQTISEYRRTMGAGYEAHKADVAKQMRKNWMGYLATQMQDVNELFIRAAKNGEMDNLPKSNIDYVKLEELASAHYVETGRVLHHTEVRGMR